MIINIIITIIIAIIVIIIIIIIIVMLMIASAAAGSRLHAVREHMKPIRQFTCLGRFVH